LEQLDDREADAEGPGKAVRARGRETREGDAPPSVPRPPQHCEQERKAPPLVDAPRAASASALQRAKKDDELGSPCVFPQPRGSIEHVKGCVRQEPLHVRRQPAKQLRPQCAVVRTFVRLGGDRADAGLSVHVVLAGSGR
jgi:hypothetical protein